MKKTIFTILTILAVSLHAHAVEYNNDPGVSDSLANSNSAILHAIDSESGTVSNYMTVDTISQIHNVGKSSFYGKDHRSIITFDTSIVPEGAQITYALLLVGIDAPAYEGNHYEYVFNNISIDFAPANGFGGSHVVTGLDYWAAAQASFNTVIANGAVGGLMLNLDVNQNLRDLTGLINPNGKTQIRLRFFTNPEPVLLNLSAMDLSDTNQKISLYIAWE